MNFAACLFGFIDYGIMLIGIDIIGFTELPTASYQLLDCKFR
jgi:hypothetical protein